MKAFRLEGGSMRPLFREGETALIRPLTSLPAKKAGRRAFTGRGGLRRGDCAVYLAGGRTLLHRVAGFAGERVVLRDDGWEMPAHAVHPRHILGRVVSANPLKSGWPGYAWFLSRGLLKWFRKNPS
jgi:hypothetical protein